MINKVYEIIVPRAVGVPSDLTSLIEKTKNVLRYQDPRYPDGMISDTLYGHLLRLASLAKDLGLDENMESLVIRTIWIHDLPEVQLGDQASVLVADSLVEAQDEISVAEKMLANEDLELYRNYERSAGFLRGKNTDYDEVGLITKVLDSIEGNLYFHKHVFKWVMAGNKNLPPDTALTYTFQQKAKYMEQVNTLPDGNLKTLLTELFEWEIKELWYMWKGKEALMPSQIKLLI